MSGRTTFTEPELQSARQTLTAFVVRFGLETALLAEAARRGMFRPQVLPAGMDHESGSTCPAHPSHLAPSI